MTCTTLETARAQLAANPKTAMLAPVVTFAKRNNKYGSILCYHHGRHVLTLHSGIIIWKGGLRQLNHNRVVIDR